MTSENDAPRRPALRHMLLLHRVYETLKSLIPERARPPLRRSIDRLDGFARLAFRARNGRRLPPWSMRRRVGGATIAMYVDEGRDAASDIERALATAGGSLRAGARVLDWGCGAGRTAYHFIDSGTTDLWGCDVDHEAISWMQRAIPNGAERFVVSGFSPPLPYPDDHFDVIYAMSIFTHFTEADQMAWLRELARVLTPDGMAVLTTSGETAMDKTWWERVGPGVHDQLWPATGRLDEVGFAFASYADVASDPEKFPGVEGTYGLTFQSEEWTRERWGEVFDIVQYRPAGLLGFQDIVVVRQQGRAAIDAAEVDAAEVDAAA